MHTVLRAVCAAIAGMLGLAGCDKTPGKALAECRFEAFVGDWTDAARPDHGVYVGGNSVTVTAGKRRSPIAFVTQRDFGPVTRRVLRQEFGNLAATGGLPAAAGGLDETVCALHLIRPRGPAALVASGGEGADGGRGLVYLEESGRFDPPLTMRLKRGAVRPGGDPQ